MARNCFVYARTDEIRYVGRSVQPDIRLRDHMRKTAPNGNRRRRWLHALKRRGLGPVFWILEVVPEDRAGKRETWWIHHFWRIGARLTNETDSGEHSGGWNRGLTKDTDHRVRKAWNKSKTKVDDPRIAAYGERGGKVRTGRTHSEIHKQRIGESLKKAYAEGRHVRPTTGPTRKC